MSSILKIFKSRKIQMYAGEPARHVEYVADFAEICELLTKGQEAAIKAGIDLVQEQNKVKQLEKDKSQLTTDLTNKNNEINTLLTKWKTPNLNELSEGIQSIVNELDVSDEDLNNQANHIKVLKAKNEKLTNNQKKLYSYLGDAWNLISHLQKDLSATQQDKAHIQQELNDVLTILNKPTAEMGTQTDLTAEQISQMEKDLENKTTKIAELTKEQNELTNQITQKETEINQLKEQAKDLEPNDTEKKLIGIVISSQGYWVQPSYGTYFLEEYKKQLETGKIDKEIFDWTQLRSPYSAMRKTLMEYIGVAMKRLELKGEIEREIGVRNQLQTKYNMEVRSKEELVETLNLAKQISSSRISLWVGKNSPTNLKEQIERMSKLIKQGFNPFEILVYADGKEDLDFSFLNDYTFRPYFITIWFTNYTDVWEKRKIKVITQYPNIDKLEGEDYVAISERKINKHRFHFSIFDGNPIKIKEIKRELIKESKEWKDYTVEYEYWR